MRMGSSYPLTQREVEGKKWRISSSHLKIAVSQVFEVLIYDSPASTVSFL